MYLDFILIIANYIEKKYPEPSIRMGKEKFYKRSAECFVLNRAMIACLDYQNTNPIEVFDELIFDYTLSNKQCTQAENKHLYSIFVNTLIDVRDHFS